MTYPKRLIEVDLPIKRISEHARREKSIRHGHISTLHIWWARRPLAACRAVLCAALWPDPADPDCPQTFREAAATQIVAFARQVLAGKVPAESCSEASFGRWNTLARDDVALDASNPAHQNQLRYALLDFIADFANWDNSTVKPYLETSRALTQAAHEALAGAPGTRPLVVDPFAGGGAIPLEALRVGADAFASDLNPVAVLLNKVVLEYIPKYGNATGIVRDDEGKDITLNGLSEMVRFWGNWIRQRAEKELGEFYPEDSDGAMPMTYLWARTIRCEGPGCGAEVPLVRSLWLAKKGEHSIALSILPDKIHKCVDFEIIHKEHGRWVSVDDPNSDIKSPQFDGTVKRGSATCPVCGYTTPVTRVRAQLKERRGGNYDARLFCVVLTRPGEQGRSYRLPNKRDLAIVNRAVEELERRKRMHNGALGLVPDEVIPFTEIRRISPLVYGITTWGDFFTPRQALALTTLVKYVKELDVELSKYYESGMRGAIRTLLALAVDKQADLGNSLNRWEPVAQCPRQLFGRQAIPIVWDFAEGVSIGDSSGSWAVQIERAEKVLLDISSDWAIGQVNQASATAHPLPADSANAFVTDPPYYDAVPYAHLADFFYVWLKRMLRDISPDLFSAEVVPKEAEIVVDRSHELSNSTHNIVFYERELTKAFAEGQRVLAPDGIGLIVFASKTTSSWEAILKAVVDAGWTITASWPIDTEMETRVSAQGQARLSSSVHLVCRPRAKSEAGGTHDTSSSVGDWRDVLAKLPGRIKDWMSRLAQEGVVGADAIFACLGPALEIFSRYERVEKADGTVITLHEYLEQVWASVGREALNQIFAGADPTGFEEDGRLTALWLWTLSGQVVKPDEEAKVDEDPAEDAEDDGSSKTVIGGFALEYDTARKLAQGTGAHLEALNRLGGVVEIKADKARLLGVAERRKTLLGAHGSDRIETETKQSKRSGRGAQMAFEAIEKAVGPMAKAAPADDELGEFKAGETTLDRIHQSMLLFGEGRGEALKRFLVEDGAGQDQRFWRLAQTLSALYPASSQEKRWVDGVLARKKGLGL